MRPEMGYEPKPVILKKTTLLRLECSIVNINHRTIGECQINVSTASPDTVFSKLSYMHALEDKTADIVRIKFEI